MTAQVSIFSSLLAIYDVVEEKVDSEPEFQYIPEKSLQDPTQLDQHALRDSMMALKEGLSSGAILAQFDVRRAKFKHSDLPHWLEKEILILLIIISVLDPTATVQEEAGDDHAVCQITSERFQKPLQGHLTMYGSTSHHTLSFLCCFHLQLWISVFPAGLYRWCHTGRTEKHRRLHQCKLHQCKFVPPVSKVGPSCLFLSFYVAYLC